MSVDIRKPLKKLLPHLIGAKKSELNEADTVKRLGHVFAEVLGYDPMSDISHEAQMKGKYVDIVLKIEGTIRVLVEVKAAGEKLRASHIDQAEGYASHNNFKWVILTNGTEWHLYHLTFGEGIESERAWSFDLSVEVDLKRAEECLVMLHKSNVKKGALEDFWKKASALNPASVGRALFHETVLAVVKREIRKKQGLLVDQDDLVNAIHEMLSPAARELIGPPKVVKRRAAPPRDKVKQGKVETADLVVEPASAEEPLASIPAVRAAS